MVHYRRPDNFSIRPGMTILRTYLRKFVQYLFDTGAMRASISWRPFSLASYRLVTSLAAYQCVPRAVIDVGANEGQFSRAILKTFPEARVFAFEPLPMAADKFKRNLGGDARVTLLREACGYETDNKVLNVNAFSQSSSYLDLANAHQAAFPGAVVVGKIVTKVARLDDALAEEVLQKPVLLKIDVQGYELNVLKGATEVLRRVSYILVETSFMPMYRDEPKFEEVMSFLMGAGFRFVAPLSMLWDDRRGIALQMDALFERVP